MCMAGSQFRFGDFTEEERHSFLDHPPCVEFPWVCETGGQFATKNCGDELDKGPAWDCDKQVSLLKDENQNHVPNKTIMGDSPIEPVNRRTNPGKLDVAKVEQPQHAHDGIQEQKTYLETTVAPDNTAHSKPLGNEFKAQKKLKASDGPLANGHYDESEHPASADRLSEWGDDAPVNQTVSVPCVGESTDNAAEQAVSNESAAEKTLDSANEPGNGALPADDHHAPAKPPSTWASLFSGQTQAQKPGKPVPFVEGAKPSPVPAPPNTSVLKEPTAAKKKSTTFNGTTTKPEISTKVVDLRDDPLSRQIAEQISRNEIVYRSPGLLPRGFINSSTWCYINATLQALLTCSPFCHLMRSFPSRPTPLDNSAVVTSTPILDSFVRLVKELKPMSKRNPQRNAKEQLYGLSHEPEYIYKMLSVIKSNLSERGRQEDAEEFLSCVLNGLHEEMLKLTDHYFGKSKQAIQNGDVFSNSQADPGNKVPVHEEDPDENSNDDQEQWKEVYGTRKSRSSVTRRADISKTPVSDVFRGELRSDLSQEGQRPTATLEPFFTLQLDINDQNTWSVNDALEHLTRTEVVQDFTNSKTKAKVEATRRQSLETLPPVLILHLKRFVYDKTGGSLKLDKEIQYHTDLVINKELLSKSSRKISQDKRTYKLFAIVYHHGKKSTGGHYTTDVYHDGLNCWLRIDDQHIKTTNVHEVVRHNPQRTAYLLYYKRTDLMSV